MSAAGASGATRNFAMKRWLVTFRTGLTEARQRELLEELHCTADDPVAIPLDDGETVVEVEGPDDLDERCRTREGLVTVYPSSEMTPY